MQVELTPAFHAAFPEGIFGAVVVAGCPNRPRATVVQTDARGIAGRLRERFPAEAIDADPITRAYAGYFRRYGGRYPVVHQAKAILEGRPVENPSALVALMFTAEMTSLLLTSGHDLRALAEPLRVDVAQAGETYTKLSGKTQALKPGDMVVRDAEGVIASVFYGPDLRTRLRPDSDAALFGAWCPIGIPPEAVDAHLDTLAELVRQEWPGATVAHPGIWRTAGTG